VRAINRNTGDLICEAVEGKVFLNSVLALLVNLFSVPKCQKSRNMKIISVNFLSPVPKVSKQCQKFGTNAKNRVNLAQNAKFLSVLLSKQNPCQILSEIFDSLLVVNVFHILTGFQQMQVIDIQLNTRLKNLTGFDIS
jgi:hypothetical protein